MKLYGCARILRYVVSYEDILTNNSFDFWRARDLWTFFSHNLELDNQLRNTRGYETTIL